MYGAIIGDIVGSPYEFNENNIKTKEFPLFSPRSEFTDDTVMTLAVAKAFMDAGAEADDETVLPHLYTEMKRLGRAYPAAGYGARFSMWLFLQGGVPYNSYGNGSAMRVSAIVWMYDSIEATRKAARLSAQITHNHPEGIIAFLEGENFEDVLRTAVSLGGDSDTLIAIAGSIAEAYYGVPEELKQEALCRLPDDLKDILLRFEANYQ